MAYLEQMGAQILVCNAAVTGAVGVARQQDAGILIVQTQDQAVIIHFGVQGGELLQERIRIGFCIECTRFRLQRGAVRRGGRKDVGGQPGAEGSACARLHGADHAAVRFGERAQRNVIIERAQEFALRRVLCCGHIERAAARGKTRAAWSARAQRALPAARPAAGRRCGPRVYAC